VPTYVRACERGWYHLRLWKKGTADPGEARSIRAPARCRSWRHSGRCAVERSQEDFERINRALMPVPAEEVLLLVLTFDQAEWVDEYEAFNELRNRWRSLAKAMRRQWGELQYVSTVERHTKRTAFPHLNVIVASRGMADAMRVMPGELVKWLKSHAEMCGFGNQLFVEGARSREQVAGYIVKLADKASVGPVDGKTVGEVVKLSQLPRNAPKGFRRLRSSRGFLPKVRPESEYTGELVRFPHPDKMGEEQKQRWSEHLEWLEWKGAHQSALESLPPERFRALQRLGAWDRSQAPPLARVVLDVGPPPPGEEWIDGAWRELEQARLRALEELRAAPPVQEELF
jgi:hypothetical protein